MSGLVVDTAACVGCRRCVRSCANDGIEVVDRKARVLDGCVACGMCVDACPVGALRVERGEQAGAADLAAWHDIWVFCQVDEAGEPLSVALELLGRARALADARGCRLVAVVGERAEAGDEAAELLLVAGADEVIRCRDDRLARPCSEVFAAWLVALVRERQPETLLLGATNFGRELAPLVAVRLQTGLTADCTVLEVDAETGLLQQTRPAFGGNLMATIVCPSHRPQMATVRPGVFAVPEACEELQACRAAAEPQAETPVDNDGWMRRMAGRVARVLGIRRRATIERGLRPTEARARLDARVSDVTLDAKVAPLVHVRGAAVSDAAGSITDAEVLVVVGRGVGGKKGVALARRLAEALGERFGCVAAVGCTRPVVEAGWLGYAHQVGQTGVSVAPKLLVSLGVSGAVQHVAGIGGAGCVVAVNEDAEAPIFASAQYKVVGDCLEAAQALLDELAAELA